MYKPGLYEAPSSQEIISTFGGYSKKPVIGENEFCNMENMSSSKYPLLSPRSKRAYFNVSGEGLHGLFAKSKLFYINNNALYYGGEKVQGIYLPDETTQRQFVSMGARLLIFPDKLYVNTADFTDYGSLEATFESGEGVSVTASVCKGDGELYEGYVVSATEPENAENGSLWLDTSVTPNSLKQFSGSLGSWFELSQTYIRIACGGIGKGFSIGDGVTLSGFLEEELNGSKVLTDCGDDYITVAGVIGNTLNQTKSIKVERLLPEMDFICESGNRLWGCNSKKNEIYASKLGDPKNFNCFTGISTDSYAASVGSDGEFTASTAFRGYVLFFKENCVHKIYGQNPPFSITTAYIRGVQKGSEKSLVSLNESLYYKSPAGICTYEGGVPVDISGDLGGEYFTDGVAGALGNKYYICLSDKDKSRVLFVYDEEKNLWHKEDNIDISHFACHNQNLYFIARISGEKRLCLADGVNCYGNFAGELSGYSPEEKPSWFCETGVWGLNIPENKYYSAITIRLWGEKGARIWVDFQINSNGKWQEQVALRVENTGSFALPFTTPRCDHLKIRLRGKGDVVVYGISRKTEKGSELNV